MQHFFTCFLLIVGLLSIPAHAATRLHATWYLDELEWRSDIGEVIDSGGRGYHGTASFGVTTVPGGVVCRAGDFSADGTADYLDLDYRALDGLSDFTLSVWGKLPSSSTQSQTLFSAAEEGRANSVLMFFSNPRNLTFYYANSVVASFNIPTASDDTWHHYVWTRSGRQHCLYIDGNSYGCNSSGSTQTARVDPNGLKLAQEQDSVGGSFVASQDWEGLIDEPLIFSSQLTGAEVQSVFNNQRAGRNWDGSARSCPVPPPVTLPSPRAQWRLDEAAWVGAAGEIKDYSANAFHGQASEAMVTSPDGVVCRAIDLTRDNTYDYINLNSAPFHGLDELSISVWGKTQETGSQALLSGFGPDHNNELLLWFARSNYFQPMIKNDTFSTGSRGFSTVEFADNRWHHFVYTRRGARNCLYIDGALQGCRFDVPEGALNLSPGAVIMGQEQDALLGRFDWNQDWDGWLDEPMVFDSELSAAQVAEIYRNQQAGNNYDGTPRRCDLPDPVVNYRFDSCNWSGGQDVIDSSPNRLDAYAENGILSTVGGQVCGLAQFDSQDDFVRLPNTAAINFSNQFTAMGWINLKNTPTELKSILSKDTNYEYHINPSRQIFWWWQDSTGATRTLTSAVQVDLNRWHHVAIVYRSGLQLIYLDGQEVARSTYTGNLANNSNDLQIGQDNGISSRFFDGDIDEVKLFDVDLDRFEVASIYQNELAGRNYDGGLRSCNCSAPPAVDHYAVSHAQTLVSCMSTDITFTAHSSADLPVDAQDALLQISTSTSKGRWLNVVNGSGTLTVLSNGQARYQFPDNGESSVTLRFAYPDLSSDPELVNFNVTDGTATDWRNAGHGEDRDLQVSDTGLVFDVPDIPSCQATATVVLRAVKKADNSASCQSAVVGNQSVSFYSEYVAPVTGTQAVILSAQGTDYTLSGAAPGTAVNVRFNAQGEAPFTVRYNDAGQLRLQAALQIGEKRLVGSDLWVSYPSRLTLSASSASGLLDNSGVVWAAGRPFTLRSEAQCADGTLTPNYRPASAQIGAALSLPRQADGGNAGALTLSGNTLAVSDAVNWQNVAADFTSTGFADTAVRYSEVGVIDLFVRDTNYFGYPIATSQHALGRFIPWHFGVATNTPQWDAHCPAGAFAYQNESLGFAVAPELTLTAYNAQGARVRNYGGTLWRLSADMLARSYQNKVASSATLSAAVQPGSWSAIADYDGVGINRLAADTLVYQKVTPEAPFNVLTDLLLSAADLTDADGGDTVGACYRIDSDNDGDWLEEQVCRSFTLADVLGPQMRFGRLALTGAYGPETAPLPVPWQVEYYDGSDFILNADDSCTQWQSAQLVWADKEGRLIADGLTAPGFGFPATDFRVDAGDAGLIMSAPGAGNQGVIALNVDLSGQSYLQHDWDGDGLFDDDPAADIVFGQYRSHDKVIFQRQW